MKQRPSRLTEVYKAAFAGALGEHLQCYNHNHGPDGRFTTASGATSSVSAGHGERSHRYTAKDIIGAQVTKRTGDGGHRRAKGSMLAGRTAKTGPGGADPTDAAHGGGFADRGSVRLNQRALSLSGDKRMKAQQRHDQLSTSFGRARRQLQNAPKDPFARQFADDVRDAAGRSPKRAARIARTQKKATAGAAAMSRPNISTKGGYPFAKVARFRPRGRK